MAIAPSGNGGRSEPRERGYASSTAGILIPQYHSTARRLSPRQSPLGWKASVAALLVVSVTAFAPKDAFVQTAESHKFLGAIVEMLFEPIAPESQAPSMEEALDPEMEIVELFLVEDIEEEEPKEIAKESSSSAPVQSSSVLSAEAVEDEVIAFAEEEELPFEEFPAEEGSDVPSRRTRRDTIPERTAKQFDPPEPAVEAAPEQQIQQTSSASSSAGTTSVSAPALPHVRDRIIYIQDVINHNVQNIQNIDTQTITENIMNTIQNTTATNNIAVTIGEGAGNPTVNINPSAEANGDVDVSGSTVTNYTEQTGIPPAEEGESSSAPDVYTQSEESTSSTPPAAPAAPEEAPEENL